MQSRFSSQSLGIYSFPSSFSLFLFNLHTFQQGKTRFWDCIKKILATGGYPIDLCTWSWGGFYDWIEGWNHVVCCMLSSKAKTLQTWIQMSGFLKIYCSLIQYIIYMFRDFVIKSNHSSRKLVEQKKKPMMMDGIFFGRIAPPKASSQSSMEEEASDSAISFSGIMMGLSHLFVENQAQAGVFFWQLVKGGCSISKTHPIRKFRRVFIHL